jgi:hypothetical protein
MLVFLLICAIVRLYYTFVVRAVDDAVWSESKGIIV